jgi:ABC-2 type transport system ATP-binding protein
MTNDIAIKAQGLTKAFGNFIAANELSFEVKKGEIFGFLGANGAGKTTAIRMLCGLLRPTRGTASIGGFDIYEQTEAIKRTIGYMSQKFSLYEDLTVYENIEFFGGIYGLSMQEIRTQTKRMLEKLELKQEANTLVRTLPLGWKQKLAFSVAILHQPTLVFLDEPTSGVDPLTRRQFWDLIYEASENGITIFVSTHYMDEAEYCDRVSIMVDGSIKALDSPSALKATYQAQTMEEVFFQLAATATNSNQA